MRTATLGSAFAALTTAWAAVFFSLRAEHWNTSSLVRMHSSLPLARLAVRDDPHFLLRGHSGFYDGAYFYAVARDPLALGQAHRLLETPSYYWGHPAYGWLAWLTSGGGNPHALPDALLTVGLASIAVAGGAASLLAVSLGWTAWGGLAVALNPGLVFAVANDTSEPLGAALLLLSLLAYLHGRRGWAIVALAALCFAKEPLVLVPLVLAGHEAARRRPPWTALAVIPALLWWLYLRAHLGAFPSNAGGERLTAPFLGWWRALEAAATQSWLPTVDTAQLGQAAVPLIVCVAAAIILGIVCALRSPTPVALAFLPLAIVYFCITPNGVQYPKDLIRELALVLTLLPFVVAIRASALPRQRVR
jgi:hypothetical protein